MAETYAPMAMKPGVADGKLPGSHGAVYAQREENIDSRCGQKVEEIAAHLRSFPFRPGSIPRIPWGRMTKREKQGAVNGKILGRGAEVGDAQDFDDRR